MAVAPASDARQKPSRGVITSVVAVVAVVFSLYQLFYLTGMMSRLGILLDIPFFYRIDIPQHLAIHLGLMLLLVFLTVPIRGGTAAKPLVPWYDVVLGIFAVGWNLYVVINYQDLVARSMTGYLSTVESIAIWLHILVVLEAGRRFMGWVVPAIAAFFLIYTLYGDFFPGFLRAPGHDWTRVARGIGLFVTGIYGSLLNMSATVLFSFILLAQVLSVTGSGAWFIEISQTLLGHVRGGPAKVAVVASALMGTITGSSAANAAGIGVFTIPMMKETGYKPHFAGAVEAAASNGGQLMPPVMGIAAFMMADFLDLPYSRIALAGVLPAVFYFLALFLMVDSEAARTNLSGIPRADKTKLGKTVLKGWQFALPLGTLIFLLLVVQYSAETSALYSTAVFVLVSFFAKSNRLTPYKLLLMLKSTAIAMTMIAVMIGVSAIIVASVELSGLSFRLSNGIVGLAGGNVWLLLLLTAVCSIVLGMGMPTSAVYIMMAVLVAPALVQVGFLPLAAHFFVFFFGVAALITPPVASTSYIAASIARADPLRTAVTASRLAIITFLAPFIFIFRPAFLMEGTLLDVLLSAAYALAATVALAGGLSGYLFGRANYRWRALFIACSIAIIYPSELPSLVGSIVAAVALLAKFILSRVRRAEPATASGP